MSDCSFFFAGGGTGGHIYPAIAVAQQITKRQPQAKVHFFCSGRKIDSQILSKNNFEFTALPAEGFSIRPDKLLRFCGGFIKSYQVAKNRIAEADTAVIIGVGGFIAAPVCWAAKHLKKPMTLINVDIRPGKANKLIARFANQVFVQFEETAKYFAKHNRAVNVFGCPLRSDFYDIHPEKAVDDLGLNKNKKTLLITGASSGSERINNAVCALLDKLADFAESWQIVHLAGANNYSRVIECYKTARISGKVLDYYDDMANLLGAADLVVARSGAVSIAEFAAVAVPCICMPYPYHKDRHQYLNAEKLVEAGAAVIVDDLPDEKERADWLWEELKALMGNEKKLNQIKQNCKTIAKTNAANIIAQSLLNIAIGKSQQNT